MADDKQCKNNLLSLKHFNFLKCYKKTTTILGDNFHPWLLVKTKNSPPPKHSLNFPIFLIPQKSIEMLPPTCSFHWSCQWLSLPFLWHVAFHHDYLTFSFAHWTHILFYCSINHIVDAQYVNNEKWKIIGSVCKHVTFQFIKTYT